VVVACRRLMVACSVVGCAPELSTAMQPTCISRGAAQNGSADKVCPPLVCCPPQHALRITGASAWIGCSAPVKFGLCMCAPCIIGAWVACPNALPSRQGVS
jgi:hypothetical protein